GRQDPRTRPGRPRRIRPPLETAQLGRRPGHGQQTADRAARAGRPGAAPPRFEGRPGPARPRARPARVRRPGPPILRAPRERPMIDAPKLVWGAANWLPLAAAAAALLLALLIYGYWRAPGASA